MIPAEHSCIVGYSSLKILLHLEQENLTDFTALLSPLPPTPLEEAGRFKSQNILLKKKVSLRVERKIEGLTAF